MFLADNGIGENSPLEVVSILMGNRAPSGSIWCFITSSPSADFYVGIIRTTKKQNPLSFCCSGFCLSHINDDVVYDICINPAEPWRSGCYQSEEQRTACLRAGSSSCRSG